MKNKISAVISIIISAFLIIAVSTFWRPCHGVMAMPCEHSILSSYCVTENADLLSIVF